MSDFAMGFLGAGLLAYGLFSFFLRLLMGQGLGDGVGFFCAVSGAFFLGGALFSAFMNRRSQRRAADGGGIGGLV